MRATVALALLLAAAGCNSRAEPEARPVAVSAAPPPCVVFQPPRRACCHGPEVKVHCCAAADRTLFSSTDVVTSSAKLLGEGATEDGECTYTFGLADGTQARAKVTRWDAKTHKLDDLVAGDREAGRPVTALDARTLTVSADGERGAWLGGARSVAHLQVDEALLDAESFVNLAKKVSARLSSP